MKVPSQGFVVRTCLKVLYSSFSVYRSEYHLRFLILIHHTGTSAVRSIFCTLGNEPPLRRNEPSETWSLCSKFPVVHCTPCAIDASKALNLFHNGNTATDPCHCGFEREMLEAGSTKWEHEKDKRERRSAKSIVYRPNTLEAYIRSYPERMS